MPIEISVNTLRNFSVGLLFREVSRQNVKYPKEIAAANGKHDYNEKEMEKRRNRQRGSGQIYKVCSTHKSGETFQRILLPFSKYFQKTVRFSSHSSL